MCRGEFKPKEVIQQPKQAPSSPVHEKLPEIVYVPEPQAPVKRQREGKLVRKSTPVTTEVDQPPTKPASVTVSVPVPMPVPPIGLLPQRDDLIHTEPVPVERSSSVRTLVSKRTIEYSELEFNKDLDEVGRGNSAVVYRGKYRGQTVAIKILTSPPTSQMQEFLKELEILCYVHRYYSLSLSNDIPALPSSISLALALHRHTALSRNSCHKGH
jgi:hypothetical protein